MTTRRPGAVKGLQAALRPAAKPEQEKPVRVTLDLEKADYVALNRWIGTAAIEVDPDLPRLTQAQALRAMIRATVTDPVVAAVVIDLLRRS